MNETTKIIIETSVTVVGMLAAFLVAVFAEPIKNRWENKSKLENLRLALYKELIQNYFLLSHHRIDHDNDAFTPAYVALHGLRTECYEHVLQNEIPCFIN
jgi:hypothetical protein